MFLVNNTPKTDEAKIILAEEVRRRPGDFFLPNQPQADLVKAIGTGLLQGTRIYLVTSGNGTGKTTVTLNIIRNIVFGPSNVFRNIRDDRGRRISGFFDYPAYKRFPPEWPRQLWYVSNKDSLKGIFEEFQNWFSEDEYKAYKGGHTYVSEIFFSNKWKLSFKTVDQDPKTFESANVGGIIFDEPPPLELYRAGLFRLRKGGFILIPATPLFGAAWFVDEIVNHADDPDKYHQTVSVHTNCVETSGYWDLGPFGRHPKGCLFERDIKFMLDNADPDERAAREFGNFQHLSGLVYKTYNNRTDNDGPCHFRETKSPLRPELYVYQFVIDPHDRRPPSAVWIRQDQYGRKTVIREWPSTDDKMYQGRMWDKIKSADPYIIEDFVREWIRIEKQLGIRPDRLQCLMDPNFGNKPIRTTGRTVAEEYSYFFRKLGRPRGFITDGIVDDLAIGHKRVKEFLKPTVQGDLYLVVDKSCKNVDWSFRTYKYEEWKGVTADRRDLSEIVSEKGKDFCDLIRYACVMPFKWWPLDTSTESMKDDYEYGKDEVAISGGEEDPDAQRPDGAAGV